MLINPQVSLCLVAYDLIAKVLYSEQAKYSMQKDTI